MKPTICAWLICKNEVRDIPRAIRSIHGVVDQFVIVDTGSTDQTEAAARAAISKPLIYERYTDASELVDGDWKLMNFAKARNRAAEIAENTGADWILWLDADDELLTPLAVNRARYMPPSALGMWIELGGGTRQVHYRMFPRDAHVRFKGYCHEFPVLGNLPAPVLNDVCIRHDATPGSGETSNARNLRILESQYKAEPDARCAFYLANTHKDGRRWSEAIHWYHVRLGYGDAFRDEYLFALLYLARCLRSNGEPGAAGNVCEYALELAPDWQEFRMELAFAAYDRKDYAEAMDQAQRAFDRPIPQTVLWREPGMYKDQPARLISWCHQHEGRIHDAIAWSEAAANRIGGPDDQWQARHRALIGMRDAPPAPAIVKRLRRQVALVRPGAIGDILMTLNLLPSFLEANPDTDVHYFCAAQYAREDALGGIIAQAGAVPMDVAGLDGWRKNYDRIINLVGYPLAEGYPDKPMQLHLLQYFAMELGLSAGFSAPFTGMVDEQTRIVTDIKPDLYQKPWPILPQLALPRPERFVDKCGGYGSPYATIQTLAGWSKYKQWSLDRWATVYARARIPFVNIGEAEGLTLAQSIRLFAHARMHIGIDSFCNHLTNYLWTDADGARRVPGVILWGSTQASAAGYPDNINISLDLPCQPCFRENPAISRMPRGPCVNRPRASYDDDTPWACMDGISVERVVEAVREMWERTNNEDERKTALSA